MTETLARSLIRLIVTVAILAAVYFFLVRPILDTTNDTIDKAFDGVDGSSSITTPSTTPASTHPISRASAKTDGERIFACVERVQPDVDEDAALRRALHEVAVRRAR